MILGIDPGKGGGMAIVGLNVPHTFKLDATEADIAEWLLSFDSAEMAFIERVASSPQMGVKSAFTFGQGYGFLRGLLVAMKIPFQEVSPQKWQRAMGCLTGGDKNVSKSRAQQLFPTTKVTHAIADALLIAEYGRRLRAGTL